MGFELRSGLTVQNYEASKTSSSGDEKDHIIAIADFKKHVKDETSVATIDIFILRITAFD